MVRPSGEPDLETSLGTASGQREGVETETKKVEKGDLHLSPGPGVQVQAEHIQVGTFLKTTTCALAIFPAGKGPSSPICC